MDDTEGGDEEPTTMDDVVDNKAREEEPTAMGDTKADVGIEADAKKRKP
jgi:hypothetical protein